MSAQQITTLNLLWRCWPAWLSSIVAGILIVFISDRVIVASGWIFSLGIWFVILQRLTRHLELEATAQLDPQSTQIANDTIREFSDQFTQVTQTEASDMLSGVDQVQNLINDAGMKLRNSFNGLQDKTEIQKQLLNELISNMSGDTTAEAMTYGKFISKTEFVLHEYIELVVKVSEKGISATHKMQDMVEQINSMFRVLSDVSKLTDQTNLLALNAAIEAARAGEAGRGFAIVANEVRSLSDHSRGLNEKIRHQIDKVRSTLNEANEIVGDIASMNMNVAIESKGNMDEAIKVLNQSNIHIEKVLEHSASLATTIRQDVSTAVTALQYEDIANQVVEYIRAKLMNLQLQIEQLLRNPTNTSDPLAYMASLSQEFSRFRCELLTDVINPVASTSMATGDAELF